MHNRADEEPGILGLELKIKGRVQGVGFRPFVYRLAAKHSLKGSVYNQPDGVIIRIEGENTKCQNFIHDLSSKSPKAAIIKDIKQQYITPRNNARFTILPSKKTSDIITEICPDIAVCDDCLDELQNSSRRKGYPFINCTNCGPRFTLIRDYPYDRANTSMNEFDMCQECSAEYQDLADRRFHAQPISCFNCGPEYELHWKKNCHTNFEKILQLTADNINSGKVVAIKGLGGYNLVCDATNENAVNEIRKFKKREKKPFAVMFSSLESLKSICSVTSSESEALTSWRKPIVVIDNHYNGTIAAGVSSGLNSLGAFLPYIPLHYLIFHAINTEALVVTSGNESDVPILYRNSDALKYFAEISGGILINNRPIERRADDSVIRVIDDKPQLMRRSRGYVPAPVDMNFSVDGILAAGAELSNAFCLGKHNQAIFSQHIGDLKNVETYEFYCENVDNFSRMYRFSPQQIVCDLHPDYLSTKYANESGLPVTLVQHHHAHIASVMAEFGIEEKVLGLAFDGTGYGTDGQIWGSELLITDYNSFQRESQFEYIPMPGGDRVTKEPWRTALAYLYNTFGNRWSAMETPLLKLIDMDKAEQLLEVIDKKINCPLSCSAGRLFDAVSAILGICTESNYHAEAPLLLENYLESGIDGAYSFGKNSIISFSPMIREIAADLQVKKSLHEIVTKFHNTVANAALFQVMRSADKSEIKKVVLSGGTFQNKYLTEKLLLLLRQNEFEVYLPCDISCNDGGIALGQLAVAAHK